MPTEGRCLAIVVLILSAAPAAAAQDDQWRFGVGVATQNMIDGQVTTNLDDFDGYRPGEYVRKKL